MVIRDKLTANYERSLVTDKQTVIRTGIVSRYLVISWKETCYQNSELYACQFQISCLSFLTISPLKSTTQTAIYVGHSVNSWESSLIQVCVSNPGQVIIF